jgi:hypothetical protein
MPESNPVFAGDCGDRGVSRWGFCRDSKVSSSVNVILPSFFDAHVLRLAQRLKIKNPPSQPKVDEDKIPFARRFPA